MQHKDLFEDRQRLQRRTGFAGCLLAVAAVVSLTGCNPAGPPGNPPTASAPEASRSPQTAEVTKRDIIEQIPLQGQLIVPPPAQASIAEPFKSRVERVYESVGEYVNRGEPIVELEIPSAEAYREQAKINLDQALADHKSAQSLWNPRLASAKQTLQAAENAVKQARRAQQMANAADDSAAPEQLSPASDVSSAPDLQEAIEQRRAAEQELLQLRAEMGQELEPYTSRIAEARAALNQARLNDNAGLIKSPIAGVIMTLNAQPGQEVDGNQTTPVATVVNLDALQVHSPMAPNYASHVKEGMQALLTFDETPGKEFKGRVKQLTTRSGGQEYVAILTFTNSDYLVKPGYRPHVGVKTGRSVKDAPAVPAEAVDYEDKQWFVQVRRNDNWEKVSVTPGVSDGKFTSIESGVKEGDVVLVTP